jgi:hypothetical protein
MKPKIIYIRFGFIPRNEESKIHCGDVFIGHEIGVSVYEAVQRGEKIHIILPQCSYSACVSLSGCLERKARIVTGDVVGVGSDSEPLLKNIDIVQELGLITEP